MCTHVNFTWFPGSNDTSQWTILGYQCDTTEAEVGKVVHNQLLQASWCQPTLVHCWFKPPETTWKSANRTSMKLSLVYSWPTSIPWEQKWAPHCDKTQKWWWWVFKMSPLNIQPYVYKLFFFLKYWTKSNWDGVQGNVFLNIQKTSWKICSSGMFNRWEMAMSTQEQAYSTHMCGLCNSLKVRVQKKFGRT